MKQNKKYFTEIVTLVYVIVYPRGMATNISSLVKKMTSFNFSPSVYTQHEMI